MRMARAFLLVCAALPGLALVLARPAAAAWPTDPAVNVPLCTAANNQYNPGIISDGTGGAIVAWYDERNGVDYDIYARRVSADGVPLWSANGVAVCTAPESQYYPAIVQDGAGGAIVVWWDFRSYTSYDIFAQRLSPDGVPLWSANGVAVCTAGGDQYFPVVVSDGTGGAIVTWADYRSGYQWDVYAQRISPAGALLWTTAGVAVCTAAGDQDSPAIVSDGLGGAVIAWRDARSDLGNVYAQRISAAGATQWTANGVALCAAPLAQYAPEIVSDGAGGGIATWYDFRGGADLDVYAQRVSSAGVVRWAADGVALCAAPGHQWNPVAIPDGMGGAIVSWPDSRDGAADIYAQRVSSAGLPLWPAGGVAVCAAVGEQSSPRLASDGTGGAIVAWEDGRGGANTDIYAQRVSLVGVVLWEADGVALATAVGDQYLPTLAVDGAGGAIVTWEDARGGASTDVYAQRVLPTGNLGGAVGVAGEAPLALSLEPVSPNPCRGGPVTVHFALPDGAPASLELLDVAGRCLAAREVGSLGAGRHALALDDRRPLAPGLYLVRLRRDGEARVTRVAVLR